MPRVSIIVPAYNVAGFIAETIESVQAQTFNDWELLIADDCSTDDTAAVVTRYAAADPRIRLIRRAANGGMSLARQDCIDVATGRFLAFIDADDLWLPAKLERQLAFHDATGAALTYTALRRIDEAGTQLFPLRAVPAALGYQQLLGNTAIACSAAMLDRERTGPIQIRNEPISDWILWLEIVRRTGQPARGLNEDLLRYRIRAGSLSSRKLRCARWVWHVLRQIEKLSPLVAARYFIEWASRAVCKRIIS